MVETLKVFLTYPETRFTEPPYQTKRCFTMETFRVYNQLLGESGWESNPPRLATRPATGFEDQEAHRDLTTPRTQQVKDNRMRKPLQASLSLSLKIVLDWI